MKHKILTHFFLIFRNCSVPSQLRAKMHLNDKITFGDGILACMSRDFDIFMSKHLAGQWLLNSYDFS